MDIPEDAVIRPREKTDKMYKEQNNEAKTFDNTQMKP
jgi:hypothetical protein